MIVAVRQPSFSVVFDDPSNRAGDIRGILISNLSYAAGLWAQYLDSSADIEIMLRIAGTATGRGEGASAASRRIGTLDGRSLLQDSAPFELATGTDPTPSGADIVITLDAAYARNELWLDPTPGRAPAIPADRTDAVSVFTHELGHALGFTGFRNGTTGSLPGDYLNTFDQHVAAYGNGLGFYGGTAQAVYGSPVPLTAGNYGHYGNASMPPGSDPLAGLMNGVNYFRGVRYGIGELDLAILTDVGNPILVTRNGTPGADRFSDGPLPSEIFLGAGNDYALANGGNDAVYGNQGDDELYGNQGNDSLFGGQGQDVVYGGQGNDQVYGNIGLDVIYGNIGADILFGGQGTDTLYGGQGDDVLFGDLGDDVLSGDLGADRYVFGANAGADLVLGFNQGSGDRLDLTGQTYRTISDADGSAVLTLSGGGTIKLAGIGAGQVTANYFV